MIKTKTSQYDELTIQTVRENVIDCDSWLEARDKIASLLNIDPDNATRMNRKYGFWRTQKAEAIPIENGRDSFDAFVETSDVNTLEEVVELCKVDTEKWEPKGFSITKKKSGFGWSARFSKKSELCDVNSLVESFAKRAAEHSPKKWAVKPIASKNTDCMYVLNLQDLHLGKLAHGDSTGGADWDIRIAERVYREAVAELIEKAPVARIEQVVVIVGSDMMQIDTDQSTTSKGTFVDSDSRLSKIFDVAAKMLTDTIEELASRFKVKAVVIAGNHDSTCSHFLGRYVEAWFRNHPNVTVDADPRSRKYLGYGKTLVAFDHGDETKPKNLPLIIMRENQNVISQYRFVEALVGHFHHEQSDDIKGIVVRVAPALCSPDKWHSRAGFVGSIRRSQGLLYQRENGLEAIFYSKALD